MLEGGGFQQKKIGQRGETNTYCCFSWKWLFWQKHRTHHHTIFEIGYWAKK